MRIPLLGDGQGKGRNGAIRAFVLITFDVERKIAKAGTFESIKR